MNAPSRSRPPRRSTGGFVFLSGVLCLSLGLPGSGCEQASAPPRSWPAGTVLALNDVPIRAEEVDLIAGWFALLEPQDSVVQLRRLALTNFLFPRIAAQGIDPDRYRETRAQADAWRAAVVGGTLPSGPIAGPMETEGSGVFLDLGLPVWKAALDAPLGEWTEVVEGVGSLHLLRVKKREEGPLPSLTRFTIGTFDFLYLDPSTGREAVETALDRSKLTVVDESWREAVPASWQHRLHAQHP